MGIHLLVDFGSTYTKIIAADIEKEAILGRAQAPTTVTTDITIGLNQALAELTKRCGIRESDIEGRYASSSAAGGLKMAAIGLVPELTLEAARRAALGAGAKVVCSYGFEIDHDIVREIEKANCDIVLLCGGTDGGDKKVIVRNAEMLAASGIGCPILAAGNRVVAEKVKAILEEGGKRVYSAKNVLPSLDSVEVEPAQKLIREIFIAHITKAKGLDKARNFVDADILPTPKVTLQAAALLANGTAGEPGIGSLVIVEVGGATINIHSVGDQTPVNSQTVIKGLPESKIKRTVEGDLGIRYNAPAIYEFVGQEALLSRLRELVPSLNGGACDLAEHVSFLSDHVNHVPTTPVGFNMDIVLASSAASIAIERHAGTVRQEYTVLGDLMVQHGKNLMPFRNLIGTGGIFRYGIHPEKVLSAALFNNDSPWSLKPRDPQAYIDSDYILYGVGLLAERFPDQALRIAKKYLKPVTLEKRMCHAPITDEKENLFEKNC